MLKESASVWVEPPEVPKNEIPELEVGQRFGVNLRNTDYWWPCVYEGKHPVIGALLFRGGGTTAAIDAKDLSWGVSIKPAAECQFWSTCPDCLYQKHDSEAYIECPRCNGTHKIPWEPWAS